ncbi:AAA family ATPase [Streptomyces sp. TR06-5]|uniref:AAA family ATPase n=1 Tax=Streptomyces sp. TR06-5 TaxID=3385976 RepID=UPI00399FF6D3
MRLHTLTLTAFGPFADTQHVDFDDLATGGLFLLHGATGAGKTSLLDAVCFALYGAVPGSRQQPGSPLRSHHAEAHTTTKVVLDLTIGDRRLEITRAPEQQRPKKTGSGYTRERARSALRAYDAEAGAWKALSLSHQEIGEEIGQLLGMSREQFCQVVLLPQGDFARFLRASAQERAKLLGRLFDTGRFAAAEEQLARMRKEAQDHVGEGDDTLAGYAHRLRQAVGPAIAAELAAATDTVDTPPRPHGRRKQVPDQRSPRAGTGEEPPATADALLAWAAMARCSARERHETAVLAARAAEERHQRALRAAEAARETARLRRQHADAVRRSEALEAAAEERRTSTDRLSAARAADTVAPLLDLRDRASDAHERADSAEQHARSALPPGLDRATPDRIAALERETRSELGALESARRTERRQDDVQAEIADLDRQAKTDEEELREAADWLAGWDDTHAALQRRLDDAHEATTRAEHLAGRLEPARRRLAAGHERDRLVRTAEQAEERLLRSRETATAAKERWLDLRNRRLDAYAADLAARLREGVPCDVCGATEHPDPRNPDAEHVDQATEDAALAEHQRAEADREAASHNLHAVRDQLATVRAETADDTTAHLGEAVRALEDALEASRAAAGDAHAAREALDRAAREHALRLSALQEAERRSAARTSRREALQREDAALADELRRFRDGGEEPARIGSRAEKLAARAACLAAATDAARTAAEAAGHLADAEQRLGEALDAAGFPDAASARRALLDAATRRHLQEALDTWQAEERIVAATLADPEILEAAARPHSDPEAAEENVRAAVRALREATTVADAARARCDDLDTLGARAAHEVRRTAPLRQAHERIAALSALAAGTSSENLRRMRLETYVLAARLEQVAAAASSRLAHMSGGRYTLVHTDERSSGGARSGLGLRVVDSWTGVQRDTATLSGGETFFASLSLALGLADVVTEEAGGTRLDTLFIDEGFGSLDEQTLDEVLDVLDSLRERDRCVGIVSHVPDLRTRIPVQLEVLKSRRGSSLRHRAAPVEG